MVEDSTNFRNPNEVERRKEPIDIKDVKVLIIPGNLNKDSKPQVWEESEAAFFNNLGAETYYPNPTPSRFWGRKNKLLPYYEDVVSERDGKSWIGPNTLIVSHSLGFQVAREIVRNNRVLGVIGLNPYASHLPYKPQREDSISQKIEKVAVHKLEKNTGFFDEHYPYQSMRENSDLIVLAFSENEEIIKPQEGEHLISMLSPKNTTDARLINLWFAGGHYDIVNKHLADVNRPLIRNLREMNLVKFS